MSIEEMIAVIESAKHEHYSEPEANRNSTALMFPEGDQYRRCSCGADKINAKLDEVLSQLRSQCPVRPVISFTVPPIEIPEETAKCGRSDQYGWEFSRDPKMASYTLEQAKGKP